MTQHDWQSFTERDRLEAVRNRELIENLHMAESAINRALRALSYEEEDKAVRILEIALGKLERRGYP